MYTLRGCRTDEFRSLLRLRQLNAIRPTLCTIKAIKPGQKEKYTLDYRPVAATTLPLFMQGYTGIKMDDSDIATIIDGLKHRVGGITPDIHEPTLKEFSKFVDYMLEKFFPVLDASTSVDVEEYISGLQFPESRKDQLRKAYSNVIEKSKKMNPLDVKSFIKEETYYEPKAARTINSRIDEYKVQVGPWVHAVEKEVFKLKWFIKKIPVADRSAAVLERLEKLGRIYMSTDFTAFESSFRSHIMEACEFKLFRHCTKNMPGGADFCSLYEKIALDNRLLFDAVVAQIACKRMSGEMSTSIANGFTNLMLVLFTACKEGLSMEDIELYVEGDDSIISCVKQLTTEWFEKLGFLCKMETHKSVRNASFCGMIFAEPGHSIRDPRPVLAKFGWAMRQYNSASDKTKMSLLRAKALSLACEMPNCPVLSPFAHRVMELTKSYNVDKVYLKANSQSFDAYDKIRLVQAIAAKPWQRPPDILPETRILVEMKYGIHVETQLMWEQTLSRLELGAFSLPAEECYFDRDWAMNWEDFVSTSKDPSDSIVKRCLNRLDAFTTYLPRTNPHDYRGPTVLLPQTTHKC